MTKRTTKFSGAQMGYIAAREAFNVADRAYMAHNQLMDAEGERLGLPVPFAILPEGHPLWVEAQRLLDARNVALETMREAANAMFDWSLTTLFARMGTPEQKRSIREGVESVKKMAHVEKFHREMVVICLKFAA